MKRVMLIALCAAGFFAPAGRVMLWAQSEEDFQVLQKPDNMITITGYSGRLSQIIIPASIYGQAVNEIGGNAFAGNTQLRSAVIPNTVVIIGNSAFSGCSNLSVVKFSSSLLSIGDSAFAGCVLSVPDFPEGLLSIGNSAFANNKLRAVSLPNSITRIGVDAFARNPELGEVLLGTQIENVFFNAFGSGENPLGIIAVRKSGVALGAIGLDQSFVNVYGTGGAGVYVKRGNVWIKETSDPQSFVLPTISLRGGADKVPTSTTATPVTTAAAAPQQTWTTPQQPQAPQPMRVVTPQTYYDDFEDEDDFLDEPPAKPSPKYTPPPPPQRAQDVLGSRRTIYFAGNGASFNGLRRDLAFNNRETIEEIAEILKKFPSLRVRITGYTNPMRPSSREIRNVLQPLSEARAQAVARLLDFYGISRRRMVLRGAGASEPIAGFFNRGDWYLNRRAEIVIIR